MTEQLEFCILFGIGVSVNKSLQQMKTCQALMISSVRPQEVIVIPVLLI